MVEFLNLYMKKLNSKLFILFVVLALFLFGGLLIVEKFSDFGKLTAGIERCCGNGRLDYKEQCDNTISEADYIASPYATDYAAPAGVDSVDYSIMIAICHDDCTTACGTVPPADLAKINIGCYGDEVIPPIDPCQKGVWLCDEGDPDDFLDDKVICADVYGDPAWGGVPGSELYDYCCVDAGSALPGMVGTFDIVRGTNAAGFKCDDVCRNAGGKICIGVGLMNVVTHHCKSIKHNLNPKTACGGFNTYNCQNDVNIMANDCRATFKIRMPTDCLECYDSDGDGIDEPYFFGVWETACYCK